jgi:hypothetical protein
VADPVLDAYRLAHFYGQHPNTFLDLPLDELSHHLADTIRLREVQRRERALAERDNEE